MLDNANTLHHASKLLSVLIVDDNHDIVILMERALTRHGFKVSAFTDPTEALQSLNATSNDCGLILSDIRMPRMNGYELIRKAKEIKKQVRVVLMTAFDIDDREFNDLLSDIKVDGFIQKPFSMTELNDLINKINAQQE
jgi:DNA-binding NtrC family response regulator